jgi:hypothetical protein
VAQKHGAGPDKAGMHQGTEKPVKTEIALQVRQANP